MSQAKMLIGSYIFDRYNCKLQCVDSQHDVAPLKKDLNYTTFRNYVFDYPWLSLLLPTLHSSRKLHFVLW